MSSMGNNMYVEVCVMGFELKVRHRMRPGGQGSVFCTWISSFPQPLLLKRRLVPSVFLCLWAESCGCQRTTSFLNLISSSNGLTLLKPMACHFDLLELRGIFWSHVMPLPCFSPSVLIQLFDIFYLVRCEENGLGVLTGISFKSINCFGASQHFDHLIRESMKVS